MRYAIIAGSLGMLCALPLIFAATPELEHIPPEPVMFGQIRVAELWESPVGKQIREKLKTEVELGENLLFAFSGIKPDQIESITGCIPKAIDGPFSGFLVIVTTKVPYNATTLKLVLPKGPPLANKDFHAISAEMCVHFTSPRMIAFMSTDMIETYLKPGKGGMLPVLQAAAKQESTMLIGIRFRGFPDSIREDLPAQLQPIAPIFNTNSWHIAIKADKTLNVTGQIDADNAAHALELETAVKNIPPILDEGIKDLLNELEEDEVFQRFAPFLKAFQKMYQEGKVTKLEKRIEVSMVLPESANLPAVAVALKRTMMGEDVSSRQVSQNNLKQIMLAMHNYHDAMGAFPPAAIFDKKGTPLLSWRVLLLPYLDQNNLYQQFKLDEPWDSEHNKKLIAKMPVVYRQPGVTKADEYVTHYQVFTGGGALFDFINGVKIQDITDGTSNTIGVVEAAAGVPWSQPIDLSYDPAKPLPKLGRFHRKSTLVSMCDGSVRLISDKVPEAVWRLLITPSDGMVVPAF